MSRMGRPRESQLAQAKTTDDVAFTIIGGILGFIARVVWWLIRHPRTTLTVIAFALAGRAVNEVGDWLGYTLLGALTIALFLWWLLARDHFTRHTTGRLRSWWRGKWIYSRGWQPAMLTCGLAFLHEGVEYLPTAKKITTTPYGDRITVRMLPGQTVEDYVAATAQLAQSFGMWQTRARSVPTDPQLVELWFITADPLADTVPVLDLPPEEDLSVVPVAMTEEGRIWDMPLLGSHILVAGETGSGKSSPIWAAIHALAPHVHIGTVQLWALDPKGGIELAFGRPAFARFTYGDTDSDDPASTAWLEDMAVTLEDAVAVMRRRLSWMRGTARLHQPTTAEPLILIIVDEIAALTAYVTDRALKARIAAALQLLLSQGRAAAVVVMAATQDARKEVLGFRDLFPTRIALRTFEPEQTDMILGRRARAKGALTDQIPASMPGTAYVHQEGASEPVRVRFSHITDQHIVNVIVPTALGQTPTPDAPSLPVGAEVVDLTDASTPSWVEHPAQDRDAA